MDTTTKIAWGLTLCALGTMAWMARRQREQGDLEYTLNYNNYMSSLDPKLPRGYRNNNPLNIRLTGTSWQGKVLPNTDGTFEQFRSMAHGYRAALRTMRTYINKYGCNTVAKIISRWAPENENNTQAYIKHVCEIANLQPGTIVKANDQDTLTAMAYAMSIIENGNNDYTRSKGLPDMETINQAWRMI